MASDSDSLTLYLAADHRFATYPLFSSQKILEDIILVPFFPNYPCLCKMRGSNCLNDVNLVSNNMPVKTVDSSVCNAVSVRSKR